MVSDTRTTAAGGAAASAGPLLGGVEVIPGARRRITWGAIFAGVVITLAVQLLLSLLGLGVGLLTVEPTEPGGTPGASALGIGAGIWWTLSYMIALFVG